MLNLILQNIGTIVIGLVLAGIVTAIILKIVRDKQKGKCAGCGYRCGSCPGSPSCGAKQ
ncbi:MAG: FeoB-associated Cys-rich membrane protein [Oscillospiraceae bacterium]|jgi:hypothetical protein|nr:FeoB-associated Cys-rich membrane protein [Oscillospiraceae bacterium]